MTFLSHSFLLGSSLTETCSRPQDRAGLRNVHPYRGHFLTRAEDRVGFDALSHCHFTYRIPNCLKLLQSRPVST